MAEKSSKSLGLEGLAKPDARASVHGRFPLPGVPHHSYSILIPMPGA
jgi:hypothetical protein